MEKTKDMTKSPFPYPEKESEIVIESPIARIRQMTPIEVFESRYDYYWENREKFTDKESKILISISTQYDTEGITQKQITIFNSIVSATMSNEFFKRNKSLKLIKRDNNHI